MEFENHNHVRLIISIVCLLFVISVKGSNISSSSSSQENESEKFDEVKKALSPLFDEAKEEFGPVSSWDFEEVEETFGPISDETQEAFGLISSLDLEKVEEAFGPISSSMVHEANEALGPISPSTLEEAKEASTEKSQEKFDSIASMITQSKEVTSSESNEAPAPISPSALDKAKDAFSTISSEAKHGFDSMTSFITQNKEETSSNLDQGNKKLGPMSSYDLDAMTPVLTPASSPSSFDKALDVAKGKLGSISSFFTQKKDVKSSNKAEAKPSNKAEATPSNKVEATPSIYLDHDVTIAIESLIKRAHSDLQHAIDQAKEISSDIPIAPEDMETALCLNQCVDSYESCERDLEKALEELKARDLESLKEDISTIEGEINDCRKCFLEHTDDKSILYSLEETTLKATRESLKILDQYSGHSN